KANPGVISMTRAADARTHAVSPALIGFASITLPPVISRVNKKSSGAFKKASRGPIFALL
ncbi:MAG: hypothetical protein HY591_04525, partial [Candidatus Omnitrophica bacterium]|nr:hypothetical protein [Candidatus Omnitrophota bacterium]